MAAVWDAIVRRFRDTHTGRFAKAAVSLAPTVGERRRSTDRAFPQQTQRAAAARAAAPAFDEVPNVYDEVPLAQASPRTQRLLGGIFEGEFSGLRTRLDGYASKVYRLDDGVVVQAEGTVVDRDGRIVGGFRRVLRPGKHSVHNDQLALAKSHQGRGFARLFNEHAERALAEQGYRRATVSPAYVGGYAWARRGYGWDSTKPAPFGDVPTRIVERLLSGRLSAAQDAQLRRWLDAFRSPDRAGWPAPKEIADFGEVGRDIMLQSAWQGERRLGPQRGG